jgi:hypothetical protein
MTYYIKTFYEVDYEKLNNTNFENYLNEISDKVQNIEGCSSFEEQTKNIFNNYYNIDINKIFENMKTCFSNIEHYYYLELLINELIYLYAKEHNDFIFFVYFNKIYNSCPSISKNKNLKLG